MTWLSLRSRRSWASAKAVWRRSIAPRSLGCAPNCGKRIRNRPMSAVCDDEQMRALIAAMNETEDQLDRVEALLVDFPEDPRLHFLRGSMLITNNRAIEAHRAL